MQAIINNQKKEITSLRLKLDSATGVDQVTTLENALKDAERRNAELVREVKSLQKI